MPPPVGYSRTSTQREQSKLSDNDFIDADPWAALDADSFTPTPSESAPEEPVSNETAGEAVTSPPAVPGPAPAPEAAPAEEIEEANESDALGAASTDEASDIASELVDDSEDESGLDLGEFNLDDLDMGALEADAPLLDTPITEISDVPDEEPDFDELSATLAEVDAISEGINSTVVDAEDDENVAMPSLETEELDSVIAELDDVPDPGEVTEPPTDIPEPIATPRAPMSSFLAGSGLFESSVAPSGTHDMADSDSQKAVEPASELESVVSDLTEDMDLGDLPAGADFDFDPASVPSAYKELESLGAEDTPEAAAAAVPDQLDEVSGLASDDSLVEAVDHEDSDSEATAGSTTMDDIDFSSLETDSDEAPSDSAEAAVIETDVTPEQPEFSESISAIEMDDIDFMSLESGSDPVVEAAGEEGDEDGPVFRAVLGGADEEIDEESDELDLGVSFGFASNDLEATPAPDDAAPDDGSTEIEGIDLSAFTGSAIEFTDLVGDVTNIDVAEELTEDTTVDDNTANADISVLEEDADATPGSQVDASADHLEPTNTEDATADDDFSALAALVKDVEPTILDADPSPSPLKETDELSWLDDDLKSDVMPQIGSEASEESVGELSSDNAISNDEPSPTDAGPSEADDFVISADPFSLATPIEPPAVDELSTTDPEPEEATGQVLGFVSPTAPDLDVAEVDIQSPDASHLEVPDLEVPDLEVPDAEMPELGNPSVEMDEWGILDAPNVELADIEGPANHEGTQGEGEDPEEAPPEASMWSGSVATESDEKLSDDTWGIKWTESRQGWIDDESGQQMWRPIVTTSQELSDFAIDEYLGVVFGDTTVSLATASSLAIADARNAASQAMVSEAMTRGAHAVIATSITVQTVGDNVLVSSSGTAVALKAKLAESPPAEPA